MRLNGLLAAAVASLTSLPAGSAVAAASADPPPAALSRQQQQQPLLSSTPPEQDPPPIGTTTSTLVDVLSADPDYSTLLRLLQRTQLVPALNALANGTLFSPTNAAFEAAGHPGGPDEGSLADWAWSTDSSLEQDNLLRATRDRLLYHVLNFSLPLDPIEANRPPSNNSFKPQPRPSPPPPEEVPCRPRFPSLGGLPESLETLLFPRKPGSDGRPEKPGPWLPAPHGQLGFKGQRVHGVRRKRDSSMQGELEGEEESDDWLGVDGRGKGGVRIASPPIVAGNGVVIKVDGVLELPENIGSTIIAHPDLAYLSALLSPAGLPPPSPVPPSSYLALLSTLPHLSLFAPSNAAFAALPQVERTYLESGFARDDVERLVGFHASRTGDVAWRERFARSGKGAVDVVGGGTVWVTVDAEGAMSVGMEDGGGKRRKKDGTPVAEADILASNGVVHIIDSLLVPPFTLTPEKILIGLNATRFVSLLRESGLAGYVNGSAAHEGEAYTILAPLDETSALVFGEGGVLLPPSRKVALRNCLAYHILPGRVRPSELRDGGLLPSELRTPLLKKGRQVVSVEVRRSVLGRLAADAIPLGGDDNGDGDDWAEVRFAGVQVVGEPVEVGRSIIYRVRSFLDPPADFVETAVTSLDLTTFLAAAFAARLDDRLRAAGAITLLAPDNRAWTRLGLGRDYLLLPEARIKLRAVLRHHVVDEIVYLEDLRAGGPGKRRSYPTLGGGSLAFEAGSNGTVKVGKASSGRQSGEQQRARILRGDAITANGALHVIDQVIIPVSVNVTVGNLLRGAKASVMVDLLERAGLDWILAGRQPTRDEITALGIAGWESAASDLQAESLATSFTLLAPTDEAFAAINITALLRNATSPATLLDLLKLHILPSRAPIPLDPKVASRSVVARFAPPDKGAPSRPLAIEEDVAYQTLLSATSRFGDLAFRQTRDAFVVGIKGARGIELNDWADVGASGRATPSAGERTNAVLSEESDRKRQPLINGVTEGGGVFLLDAVLVPFEPSWAQLYGWILVGSIVSGAAVLTLIGLGGWWLWKKRRSRSGTDYEPVEEEED